MNVTDCPGHIAPAGFALILTDPVSIGLTVIVITLLSALTGAAHERDDVNLTRTMSPLFNRAVANVGLLGPVLIPLTCH